jgi:hypothetical protein
VVTLEGTSPESNLLSYPRKRLLMEVLDLYQKQWANSSQAAVLL